MGNSFHNTLFLSDDLTNGYRNNAIKQEDFIYGIFLQHKQATKADLVSIFRRLQSKVSESSVSRSLSNLDRDGKIRKTAVKRQGEYGVPNTVYELVTGVQVQKVAEHKLKLDDTECLALELVLNHFKDTVPAEDYIPEFWNEFKSIQNKLSKIKY